MHQYPWRVNDKNDPRVQWNQTIVSREIEVIEVESYPAGFIQTALDVPTAGSLVPRWGWARSRCAPNGDLPVPRQAFRAIFHNSKGKSPLVSFIGLE